MNDKVLDLVISRYETARNGKNSASDKSSNVKDYIWKAGVDQNQSSAETAESFFLNMIMVHIENLCSLANDTPIDMIVQPRRPEFSLDATVYQELTRWVKEQNYDHEKRTQMQKFAALMGTGIYKVIFDKEFGGSIRYTSLDPQYVFCDPQARSHDEIQYVIELSKWRTDELKKKFPKYDVNSEDSAEDEMDDLTDYNDGETENRMVTVYEMWSKDARWQGGRHTVATNSQVLSDGENKYKCGFPYVFIPFISTPDRVFGQDMYGYLADMGKVLNDLLVRFKKIVDLNANGNIAINSFSGLDPDSVTNADGQVMVVQGDPRAMIMPIQPPIVNDVILAFAQKLEYYMQTVAGVQDISMGRATINSNLPSGRSLEELQQNAQTRLREFVRNVKNGYRRLGEKIVAIAHQFMSDEQLIRISGANVGEVRQVMDREKDFWKRELLNAGAKTPEEIETGIRLKMADKGIRMENYGKDEAYLGFIGPRLGDPNVFTIDIYGGMDIAKNKVDIAQRADMLLQAGKIDDQSYFEAIDFPLKDKILARSQQWQAFQQFLEMQKQQQLMQAQAKAQVQKSGMKDSLRGEEPSEGKPMATDMGLMPAPAVDGRVQ